MELKHVCKFCKKSFACGRSLGGHIRCHLPKPGYELRENPKKTWRADQHHHETTTTTTSSSENDTEKLRLSKVNQGKRSSFSGKDHHHNNNSQSSVSEVVEAEHYQQDGNEDEEVDVAMCLIMLSRDVGPWGNGGKNSQGNNKKKKRKRVEKVTAVNNNSEQKGLKLKGVEVSETGFFLPDDDDDQSNSLFDSKMRRGEKMEEFQESGIGFLPDENPMISSELLKITTPDKNDSKRSRFECTTCNKVFHSYQALGGHRASHKKQLGASKDCAAKRDEKELNETSNVPSPNPNDQEQLEPTPQCNDQVFTEIVLGSSSTLSKKIVQKHECPICFRVFPSGQALGGHKRSHLIGSNNSQGIITKAADVTTERSSSSSENRDLLDLNLPPAVHVQEEAASSSNSLVGLIKPYWWVENPHKHEAFLSLISN